MFGLKSKTTFEYLKYVINYMLDKTKVHLHKFLRLFKPMSSSAGLWSTMDYYIATHTE